VDRAITRRYDRSTLRYPKRSPLPWLGPYCVKTELFEVWEALAQCPREFLA